MIEPPRPVAAPAEALLQQQQQRPANRLVPWEYLQLQTRGGKLAEQLQLAGLDGWELIHVHRPSVAPAVEPLYDLIFKRPCSRE